MRKVALIGIDSFDSDLAARYWDRLPNLRKLAERGGVLPAESTYPPDSVTAWASIHTGLNPAEHGMVYFKDPLEKVNSTVNEEPDSTPIQGRTLWDMLGKAGRRSTLVFPKGAFPLWPVNGVAIARSETRNTAFQSSDPIWMERMYAIAKKHGLPDLNTLQHIPTSDRDLEKWNDRGRRLVEAEYEFAREMATQTEWEFFLTYSSVADWISHNFWPYSDENDVDFQGDNRFQNVIRDLYVLYDREIGRLVEALPEDTVVMVISDHGHGRRPRKVVNLNKLLYERGLLTKRTSAKRTGSPTASERFRRFTVRYVNQNKWIWNIAMRTIKWVPPLRRFYTRPPVIDWERSLAFITDQSGIKSYNYGGIMLNGTAISAAGRTADDVRAEVVAMLRELRHPQTGIPLVRHLYRRDELYCGPFEERMPDIVFELATDYGAGWAIEGGLLDDAAAGNICPGSHRRDTSFALVSRARPTDEKTIVTPMDITPTVLDLLDVAPIQPLSARVIVEA